MDTPLLSIIICTFNRSELLDTCLDSLLVQVTDTTKIEIIVVDNNSTDDTKEVVTEKQTHNPYLRYIIESRRGLSYARNKGGNEARGTYLGYIDDDAIVGTNFIKHILHTINHYNFDLFGGKVLPWFKYGQPRWLPDDFATNFQGINTITKAKDWQGLWGGVLFVRKALFIDIGKFPTDLGMGVKLGYGEDAYFVKKIHEANYELGMNPDIILHHLVRKEKLSIRWHIYATYCTSRDSIKAVGATQENIFFLLLKIIPRSFKEIIIGIKPLFKNDDYYWENYLLNIAASMASSLGRLVGTLNSK